jgi:threonine/homoserine efflux transporter RhtA
MLNLLAQKVIIGSGSRLAKPLFWSTCAERAASVLLLGTGIVAISAFAKPSRSRLYK